MQIGAANATSFGLDQDLAGAGWLSAGGWPMEPSCLFWSTHVFARPLRCSISDAPSFMFHVSKTAHYFPGRLALIIGTMVAFVAVIVL